MSAELLRFEQIDCVDLSVDMEVPGAEDIVFEAMDWLVGSYRVKWVEVIEEAGDCQR